MSEMLLRAILQTAVDEVLEKMFFLGTLQELGEPGGEELTAHMSFDGNPSGSMTLRIVSRAARSIAADFLGEDECGIGEQQMGEVVCELTNMVCGSLLSKVEPNTTFRLNSPTLTDAHSSEKPDTGCSEEIAADYNGAMWITLRMGESSCSPPASGS